MTAPLEMDSVIRARWTAALRSGKYQQGQQALKRDGALCCMGVLCELAVADGVLTPKLYGEEPGMVTYDGQDAYLPQSVMSWAGLDYRNPRAHVLTDDVPLATLNDDWKFTFAQIADAIDGGAVTL